MYELLEYAPDPPPPPQVQIGIDPPPPPPPPPQTSTIKLTVPDGIGTVPEPAVDELNAPVLPLASPAKLCKYIGLVEGMFVVFGEHPTYGPVGDFL